MKELVKAILTEAKSGGSASDLYEGVGSDIYFEQVPPDSSVSMPYITYHLISQRPEHTFRAADTFTDVIVQFSIFDDRRSISYIGDLIGYLTTVYDRADLTYDTKTAVGCLREAMTGPTKMADCWMATVDYRVRYK